jgi:hypothetical protein
MHEAMEGRSKEVRVLPQERDILAKATARSLAQYLTKLQR